MEQVYSRGLGPHFVGGTNHQKVVRGRAPRHRGVLMGRVAQVEADGVVVEMGEAHEIAPLKEGDGLVFDAADWRSPGEPEEGGRVYEATLLRDGKLKLGFANHAIRFDRIRPGDLVWRNSDADVTQAARQFTEAAGPVHRQRVQVRVRAHAGSPLLAEWSLADAPDTAASVSSAEALVTAQNRALSIESLREQFSRLGNTAYELAGISLDIEGAPFIPVSMLNKMRREAVEKLQAMQMLPRGNFVRDALAALNAARAEPPSPGSSNVAELHLLVRTPEQLAAAIELAPASITLDYLDLYGLRPSVERVKAAGITGRVASPRVLKPGESRTIEFPGQP